MKKIFIALFSIAILFIAPVYSATEKTVWTSENGLARVEKIGKKLLEKNNLPTQVTFSVLQTDDINAFASSENEICVYTGLLNYVQDDDELAGIIGHEMGHIVNNHVAKQNMINSITSSVISNANVSQTAKTGAAIVHNLSMLKMSRTQEYEADITGIDLMIKAGYNPLATISILYKISGNYVDFIQTHPSKDKRTMYSYDYMTYTYPNLVKKSYNSEAYKQFMAYAKTVVDKRNSSQSKLNKFNKEQAKLQAKRAKKMEKYKKTNPWASSISLLKAISAANSESVNQ